MRNILFYLFAVATLLTSCEMLQQDENPGTKPEVSFTIVTDEILYVEAEGGSVAVKYAIENPIEGEELKVQVLNTSMITAVDSSLPTIVRMEVALNPTMEQREATVILSYAGHNHNIVVKQEPSPYEISSIEANQLIGTYYGDRIVGGVGNYWLIFSKDGIKDGSVLPNTEFIRLDILGPMAADESNIKIPDGTYVFDATNSGAEYTILNLPNTDYMYVDEEVIGWSTPLSDAMLTVSGNRFDLVAYVGEKQINLTFEGEYYIDSAKMSDHISNLTDDVSIDVSKCKATLNSYGDYWHCGYCNWVVEFIDREGGYDHGIYLVLDLLGATIDASSGYVGTYISAGFSKEDPRKPNFGPMTFVPGTRISDDGVYMQGSLYMEYDTNGKAVTQAPLTTGSVVLKANGDGTHTVIVDAYDDAAEPHKLTLNWTGVFE